MKIAKLFILMMLPFISHSQEDSVTIQFELSAPENVQVKKCRGYISALVIHYEDGTTFKEENSYHLLNFINADEAQITLNVDASKTVFSIQYAIGTDSLINVTGVYDGDLDPIHGMYWAWNSGYINFKIEGTQNDTAFSYHIGGYADPYPTVRTKSHKVSANKETYVVTIDVGTILNSELARELPQLMSPGAKASKLATIISNATQLHE